MSIEFVLVGCGKGMSLENDIFHCNDFGHELLDESIENGYLTYCPTCNPVSYCEKSGKPHYGLCDCTQCKG